MAEPASGAALYALAFLLFAIPQSIKRAQTYAPIPKPDIKTRRIYSKVLHIYYIYTSAPVTNICKMSNNTCPLQAGAYYHIFNRANGVEKLFLSNENYRYFLRRFQNYISPIAHLHCYCLMPNHFHFLIEIKDEHELEAYFNQKYAKKKSALTLSGLKDLTGLARTQNISKKISLQFSHFFNSYSQAFNKQHARRGSLFMRPFKRKEITTEKYLFNIIRYIHQNPIEAGLCHKPEKWQHSSYHQIIENSSEIIDSKKIIEWFDDKSNFIYFHNSNAEFEPIY